MERNSQTVEYNVTDIDRDLVSEGWYVTGTISNFGTGKWNVTRMVRNVFWMSQHIFADYDGLTLNLRIAYALATMKLIYYPLLAIVAVPGMFMSNY